MSRIKRTFDKLKADGKKALVSFIMAGDPDVAATAKLLDSLVAGGADVIEIGMPFSDPMADGPTIQAAGLRALKSGTKLEHIFTLVQNFRKTHAYTPIVLMGYANSVFAYGQKKFIEHARDAGVDGLIIVDLPLEEAAQLGSALQEKDMDLIRLIAPTTKGERLKQVLNTCSGFVYYISIAGITGSKTAKTDALSPHIEEIRAHTDLPLCIGFGIKTPEDAKAFAPLGDGVVVGSAIVQLAHDSNKPESDVKELVTKLAHALA